jgi:Tol biopolymer transport system component
MFESAVFSPDGQKIAFLSVDIDSLSGWSWKAIDVKTMNSDGSGLTQVTDDVKAYDLDVSWSR